MKKVLKYVLIGLGSFLLILAANFFIVKKLDQQAINSIDFISHDANGDKPYLVPSQFIDSARFYVKLPLGNNDTILGFCDTGGGMSMLIPNNKNNTTLKGKIRTGILKGMMPIEYINFSDIVMDVNYPRPLPMRNFIIRKPFGSIKNSYLIVPPENEEIKMFTEKIPKMDVFFGQSFFMGKSWTMDYINQEIWVNTPLNKNQLTNPNVQPIGFKKNTKGVPIYGHPSMEIKVDNETFDVLYDTGASFLLSDEGQKLLGTNKTTIAGSFIAASIFDRWRKDHPDWKFYPNSDMSRDIIEVPSITIGEHTVGPVLFAKRPDENWSEGMIRSMDKVVKGAIGGSALQYFKITIDYNEELIRFER